MSRTARCLRCNVVIAPFGGVDLGTLVLEHLHRVHGQTPTVGANHPSRGGAA